MIENQPDIRAQDIDAWIHLGTVARDLERIAGS
jgi:hypothetical protein